MVQEKNKDLRGIAARLRHGSESASVQEALLMEAAQKAKAPQTTWAEIGFRPVFEATSETSARLSITILHSSHAAALANVLKRAIEGYGFRYLLGEQSRKELWAANIYVWGEDEEKEEEDNDDAGS